ncbi:hypothetical protein WH50_07405 [Pokkaliibacter plantistimulans]|uniref:VanZ-like domain-containing protein n=1 Tax=Pokkaliibacter plantistimulans TaxID=1635171 RepID=A0ABX5M4T0_9GAMM|nr:hypothetical protein [Pokkaliibacter plantistimulans]PXF31920.1 hypothetical protein WH50_07405 [Pokkaliibacter plantistimulans]
MLQVFAGLWGIAGVSLLLLSAIGRLLPLSLSAFDMPLSWQHWITFWFFLIFMLYNEGYRGFQKAFSPRTAARARYLSRSATPAQAIFAPFFCMGYFHTTRKRQIISISITCTVILLIILFHFLPQPWRGILDGGVVAGLIWGILSFWHCCWNAWFNVDFSHSAELPQHS